MRHRSASLGVVLAVVMVFAAVQGLAAEKYLIGIVSQGGSEASGSNLGDNTTLALDASGNIYYSNLRRVWKVGPQGEVNLVAGSGGSDYSGDGGPATAAQLLWPVGIAVDAAGILYMADAGNDRFRKIDTSGIITSFEVAELSGGHGKFLRAQPKGSSVAIAVKVDKEGNLYCADRSTIVKISPSGAVSTIFKGAPLSVGPANFSFDKAGNLYLYDFGMNQIVRIDASGTRTLVAGTGNNAYAGDGGPALRASFQQFTCLAADGEGNLYIGDCTKPANSPTPGQWVVRKIDAKTGVITKIAGGGIFTTNAVGGPATDARLGSIGSLLVDDAGIVYVLDWQSQLIWKLYR